MLSLQEIIIRNIFISVLKIINNIFHHEMVSFPKRMVILKHFSLVEKIPFKDFTYKSIGYKLRCEPIKIQNFHN